MREAEEEAERRRSVKIPTGFKDERPGDYVLWRQTIDEAKRSGRPVVLITDDRKDNWWWMEQGETVGPRIALVAEMREKAGVAFYMYTPDRLMGEARKRLDVEVSDESISEVEGLGQETGDDVTSGASSPWLVLDEVLDTAQSLTDVEKSALQALGIYGNDIGSIAQELAVTDFTARRLVARAMDKWQSDLRKEYYIITVRANLIGRGAEGTLSGVTLYPGAQLRSSISSLSRCRAMRVAYITLVIPCSPRSLG